MNSELTDRELLEMAAKAAGYVVDEDFDRTDIRSTTGAPVTWRPLDDDGDALRLAVRLGICVEPYPVYQPEKHSVMVKQRCQLDTLRVPNKTECLELYGDDPYAAIRRAIVRCAASIGQMKA